MNLKILGAGPGIELHPRSQRDTDEMWALIARHRDDLRVWLPWIDATQSAGDVRRYCEFSQRSFQQAAAFEYAIRVDGTLCGAVGTHEVDWTNRCTSIGYWLAPTVRGRGVMTLAVRALVEHCIAGLRLHRFEIRCVTDNEKSRAIPERLSFDLEGTLTDAYYLHERYRDIALYATTASRYDLKR